MAVFSKNTLTQVSGFDNQIIAGELVYGQKTYWNLTLNNSTDCGATPTPLDLTGATIDAQIIRRQLSNVKDSRYGLSFDIADYTPTPDPIDLTITNVVEANGSFTLVIDETAWDVVAGQPELAIDSVNGAGFSGRIKISFPVDGTTPANDLIVFLLFLVRSDAIVNN
jgi:hypothetical protein